MDETTSHLGPEAERRINANMAAMNMTRIIITHRQETIDSADRVFRIGEVGDAEAAGPASIRSQDGLSVGAPA